MKFSDRFIFYTQVLSLDICIGVLGSGALAQAMLKATMKPVWWFLLPASVWVVYTADHLFDARRLGAAAVNVRHKFHFDHFTPLAVCAGVIAVVCGVAAFLFLREIVFRGGALIGVLALFHVLIAYWGKIRFGKEISVAVIYACGVWFAPFLNRTVAVSVFEIAAFSLFLTGALLNLFMNSVIEFAEDERENQMFIMQVVPRHFIRRCVIVFSLLASAASVFFSIYAWLYGYGSQVTGGFIFVLLVCAVPGIILIAEKFFAKNQRYRLPAEWVFAAGTLLLLLPR